MPSNNIFSKFLNKITIKSISLTTGLVVAYYLACYFIQVPTLNRKVIVLFANDYKFLENYEAYSRFSIFLIGLIPFIISYLFINPLSIIKNNTEKNEKYKKVSIVILASIITIFIAFKFIPYFMTLRYFGETINYLVSPKTNIELFKTLTIGSYVLAGLFLIFIAHKLDKKLVINSYALILILNFSTFFLTLYQVTGIGASIESDIKTTQKIFTKQATINYKLNKEVFDKSNLTLMFDKNIKSYLLNLDSDAYYKRSNEYISISAKNTTISKIKKYFSQKHSLYFMEVNQTAVNLSVKLVENTKNLPNGITAIKTHYTVDKTGEEIKDHYFRTKSASLTDENNLKDFIKKLKIPKEYKIHYSKEKYSSNPYFRTYILKNNLQLSGLFLEEVSALVDTRSNNPYVSITFNSQGRKLFSDLTARLQGHRLAIVIDGVIDSAPVVQDRISGGRASITMGAGFHAQKVKKAGKLAEILNLSMFTSFITLKE